MAYTIITFKNIYIKKKGTEHQVNVTDQHIHESICTALIPCCKCLDHYNHSCSSYHLFSGKIRQIYKNTQHKHKRKRIHDIKRKHCFSWIIEVKYEDNNNNNFCCFQFVTINKSKLHLNVMKH